VHGEGAASAEQRVEHGCVEHHLDDIDDLDDDLDGCVDGERFVVWRAL
jgi:hypothetical protein